MIDMKNWPRSSPIILKNLIALALHAFFYGRSIVSNKLMLIHIGSFASI
jgi:hypothetical protein